MSARRRSRTTIPNTVRSADAGAVRQARRNAESGRVFARIATSAVLADHGEHCDAAPLGRGTLMRHFLRRGANLACSPGALPRGVPPRPDPGALVACAGAAQRFGTPARCTAAGAILVAPITGAADVHRLAAGGAVEQTMRLLEPVPNRHVRLAKRWTTLRIAGIKARRERSLDKPQRRRPGEPPSSCPGLRLCGDGCEHSQSGIEARRPQAPATTAQAGSDATPSSNPEVWGALPPTPPAKPINRSVQDTATTTALARLNPRITRILVAVYTSCSTPARPR